MKRFLKQVAVFGLLSLPISLLLLWFIVLPVVVFGGAFAADLFDRFGDTPRVVAGYAGLLATVVVVLTLLATAGGFLLALVVSFGRLVLIRPRAQRP